ncbi:MAG: hypothetical protein WEA29_04010 [Acidimicrobiia bacterium]
MRRIIVLIACMGLIAACGGSDAEETTTTGAAPTTTVAGATTTEGEAPATTMDEAAGRVAMAEALEGEYAGEWNNLTFDSTGAAEGVVAVDGTLVTVTLMLGGNVFGVGSPDPVVLEFDLSEPPPYTTESELFGEATIDIDEAGVLDFEAASITSLGGMSLLVEGTVTAEGFDVVYRIVQGDGTEFANGTMTMPRS